jgi:predicted restriction endonuclease
MIELNRFQKAALISNTKSREKSLLLYYEQPNICKCCNNPIMVGEKQKVSDVRKKVFCSSSCSATYNNQKREKRNDQLKIKNEKFSFLIGLTKKEFFEKKGVYYKFRSEIRKHAQYVYQQNNGDTFCKICGYDKHIQVCHIKSVSSFNDSELITDINDKNNLIGLCPNHHWEYDNGLIKI